MQECFKNLRLVRFKYGTEIEQKVDWENTDSHLYIFEKNIAIIKNNFSNIFTY